MIVIKADLFGREEVKHRFLFLCFFYFFIIIFFFNFPPFTSFALNISDVPSARLHVCRVSSDILHSK